VQDGDTLFGLALQFGVTIEAIVAANKIENPDMIRPGQTLVIPASSAIPAPVMTRTPARPIVVATPPPLPTNAEMVNGIPARAFVIMSANVKQNIREVYRKGQTLGRNPRAFAKAGDSTVENGYFFAAFDRGNYKLGVYAHLQATIDLYAGSFGRESVAVGVGYHTTTVMDPEQTNPRCQSGEALFECELRLTNPSVILIRLGANDVRMPDIFERKLRQMVEIALTQGVIPVLGTKADRQEGSANTINIIIRQIALGYKIPLWDFDLVAETMPNRGLASDNIHPTNGFVRDYTRPETFQLGHEMQDLTALIALDAIWREIAAGP
jgi:LysM repeat protein